MTPNQRPSIVAAHALLDELYRLGVRHVVLSPGSRSAPLAYAAEALDRQGRLTLHVRVDERVAAFVALGLAKTTRVPAAVVTTSGTALANLHPAVLEADHGQVPLILLTADRPPELRGVGANQATHQPGIFGEGRCRLGVDVETPAVDRLPAQVQVLRTTAARAVAAATGALGGVPGPVHLNLPLRDPLVPAGEGDPLTEGLVGRSDGRPWVALPPSDAGLAAGLPAGTPGPAAALPTADGTLVVVGDLPTAGHRATAFAWAAAHCLPVVAEPGAPPPEGLDVALVPHGTAALGADLPDALRPRHLVVVGRPTLGRSVPRLMRDPGVTVHVVTPDPGWADPTHEAAAVHPFAVLTGRPAGAPEPGPSTRAWVALGERLLAALGQDEPGAITSGVDAMRVLEAALPAGARIFLGSSSVARDHHLGLGLPRRDVDVVASRGLAGIDGCVSTASGLALAEPDRPTCAVVGDLTFLHDSGALVLGPDEPVPDLTVVVLDDRGGSIFGTLEYGAPEHADRLQRVFTTPTRTDVAALAESHGWPATTARTPDELRSALAPGTGIRVVVVPLDGTDRRGDAERLRRAVSALV